MKTNIFFRTAALIAALSFLFGCANPEIELRKGVEIQINPSTILSGFTPYKSENLEMRDGSHLRITCLLYDRNGNLAYQEQSLLDNFDQDVTFCTTLDEKNGNYTIIALATCIQGTLSSPSEEVYSISGTGSLNTLRVELTTPDADSYTNNAYSYYSTWSIMGYASQSTPFDDSVVRLNMKPATSLVYMRWKDIHANDNDATAVYSKYSAQATDYWGKNKYSWTITIEKDGNSSTDVIVKDFSPILCKNDLTADKGYNTYKGKIDGNTLTITKGQKTGFVDDEGAVRLYGGEANGEMITFKDLVLQIDNGKLTTKNLFGICVPDGSGWYELFNSGVVFTKMSSADIVFTNGSSAGIDAYGIIYHSNDIMSFDNTGELIYSTSLSSIDNNAAWVSPAGYTSSTTNIYTMHNLFPGSSIGLFARAYSGNSYTDYSNQTFTLLSGHQYVFDLDCATFKLTPYEGALGTRSSGGEFEPIEGYSLSSDKQMDFSQKQFK